jgi:ADP-ribose pyrophosphatase YjhB (NUDIX family)
MSSESPARWLDHARRLQALAQTGLTFATDPFDQERYHAVQTIAAEMISEHTVDGDAARELARLAAETGYATPKVDVRGVVFDPAGQILLVRERSDGNWTLPGGWADVGSSPTENIEREIREEAGYDTHAVKLLAVYDRNRHSHPPMVSHVYKLFLRCEIVGGAAADEGTLETCGVRFFAAGELPPLSAGRTTAGQLARMFEHYHQPDLAADCD